MIGIVVALDSELEFFEKKIENKNVTNIASKKVITGTVSGVAVAVIVSNIGKVNATLSTQILIDRFAPSVILNFGTAGGMTKDLKILDYYIADSACQYDFDTSALDNVPLGYIQQYNRVFFPANTYNFDFLPKCVVASGDRFNDSETDINNIINIPANVRDMEGGAVAHVCFANNVPLLIIKGISDVYGNGTAKEQFIENLKTVAKGFEKIILKAIFLLSEK